MTAETAPDGGSGAEPMLEGDAGDAGDAVVLRGGPPRDGGPDDHADRRLPVGRGGSGVASDSIGRVDDERIGEPWRLPSSLCPYLATESGQWRAAFPTREHRCMAVSPPVALAPDKQRRLCLVPAHETCATYLTANLVRSTTFRGVPSGRGAQGFGGDGGGAGVAGGPAAAGGPQAGASSASTGAAAATTSVSTGAGVGLIARPLSRRRSPARRPIARTTPILLERPRPGLQVSEPARRLAGQVILVALLVIAFAAIAVARFGAGSPSALPVSPSALASASPSVASPTVRPTPTPTPSNSPAASGSPRATATPRITPKASSAAFQTYTVRPGDSLSSIAARFGVSTSALQRLNGIKNPSLLRVGQVLRIPSR
jgi:LysM repeat protein